MLRNFDIDQTGLVSTANLTKVLKLMGVGGLDGKNLDKYKSGDMVRYESLIQDF